MTTRKSTSYGHPNAAQIIESLAGKAADQFDSDRLSERIWELVLTDTQLRSLVSASEFAKDLHEMRVEMQSPIQGESVDDLTHMAFRASDSLNRRYQERIDEITAKACLGLLIGYQNHRSVERTELAQAQHEAIWWLASRLGMTATEIGRKTAMN